MICILIWEGDVLCSSFFVHLLHRNSSLRNDSFSSSYYYSRLLLNIIIYKTYYYFKMEVLWVKLDFQWIISDAQRHFFFYSELVLLKIFFNRSLKSSMAKLAINYGRALENKWRVIAYVDQGIKIYMCRYARTLKLLQYTNLFSLAANQFRNQSNPASPPNCNVPSLCLRIK